MSVETRTVHLTLPPELRAYLVWLDDAAGREFDLDEYDAFRDRYQAIADAEVAAHDAGYRSGYQDGYAAGLADANDADQQAPADAAAVDGEGRS